ncbi:PI-PLC X domain-containing protein 3-like [Mya arenaria]|uniref:PI-PLC X domain-containing protein 3-like n=1 Tax=Mya arenaria TaxID=6604 RepID=UPI0022E5C7AE|nr:PI-PLC X domain-containing protein 3-like [Mya arenaria]
MSKGRIRRRKGGGGKQVEDAHRDRVVLGADWMTGLPERYRDVPLCCLAIPGSHNSCSVYRDEESNVDQRSDPIYRQYVDHMGELANKISHRWTVTQSLSITEQLDAGVRYLDIRVTARQGDREDLNVYFRNGPNIIIILKEIRRWMDLHPKEVILLDFRVVHKMSQAHHRYLLANMTDDVFRGRLLECTGVVQAVTLRNMSAIDAQIIVFYPKECEQQHTCVWPNEYIGYLHPQAQSTRDMIDRLNTRYQHGRPPHVFFSWDGVLTTTNEYLANNLHSTLRDSLSRPATRALCNWVRNKDIRHGDMNIVVADFVETSSFVDEVIRVNYELRELRKYDFESCVCNIL